METQGKFIFGVAFLAAAWALSSHREGMAFYGLGDEATSPASASYPSNRVEMQRRFLAKKFWGTTILTSEATESMLKLARRSNWYDKGMAQKARDLADKLSLLSKEAVNLANENDSAWVSLRLSQVNRVRTA